MQIRRGIQTFWATDENTLSTDSRCSCACINVSYRTVELVCHYNQPCFATSQQHRAGRYSSWWIIPTQAQGLSQRLKSHWKNHSSFHLKPSLLHLYSVVVVALRPDMVWTGVIIPLGPAIWRATKAMLLPRARPGPAQCVSMIHTALTKLLYWKERQTNMYHTVRDQLL